jgi:hypothetical protein
MRGCTSPHRRRPDRTRLRRTRRSSRRSCYRRMLCRHIEVCTDIAESGRSRIRPDMCHTGRHIRYHHTLCLRSLAYTDTRPARTTHCLCILRTSPHNHRRRTLSRSSSGNTLDRRFPWLGRTDGARGRAPPANRTWDRSSTCIGRRCRRIRHRRTLCRRSPERTHIDRLCRRPARRRNRNRPHIRCHHRLCRRRQGCRHTVRSGSWRVHRRCRNYLRSRRRRRRCHHTEADRDGTRCLPARPCPRGWCPVRCRVPPRCLVRR